MYLFFQGKRETSKCDEARESALSSKWTPPLQVNPAVTYFFHFYNPDSNPLQTGQLLSLLTGTDSILLFVFLYFFSTLPLFLSPSFLYPGKYFAAMRSKVWVSFSMTAAANRTQQQKYAVAFYRWDLRGQSPKRQEYLS